jgi:hypothetical protein
MPNQAERVSKPSYTVPIDLYRPLYCHEPSHAERAKFLVNNESLFYLFILLFTPKEYVERTSTIIKVKKKLAAAPACKPRQKKYTVLSIAPCADLGV